MEYSMTPKLTSGLSKKVSDKVETCHAVYYQKWSSEAIKIQRQDHSRAQGRFEAAHATREWSRAIRRLQTPHV
jgi:hypothetical protein